MRPLVEKTQTFYRKLDEVRELVAGIKRRHIHIVRLAKAPRVHPISFKVDRQVKYFGIFASINVGRILNAIIA